ncbi:hypothetical protein PFICI_09219 [Pestalotiopsis fici W106-1]|uniref:Alpha-type protein kinase domain-containing protein n=1 Tax=Pestalotiopsis fici (strain W106-1 / CGMCC3.15140) TaxID=1229662 RepID=W3X2I0_PESFW|nr:uncharacterized protein PFICI_09219 [Pestalotiopsis fici W106-1]ETS79366.1 hypothetical protein PFICI_09219 [Pestalotiopsis fici W106-1]
MDINIPAYAILSHTWGPDSEEVSFQDAQEYERIPPTMGRRKFDGSCAQAVKDGLDYVWIDTCCIDKTNSTELSEAINSMFRWYADASICYAYLSDVDGYVDQWDTDSAFSHSRWFSRGWTLQELIAPKVLRFYRNDWDCLGTKRELCPVLVSTTGIPRQFLLGVMDLNEASVAQRMSWAAKRSTRRKEDLAYCLLGLFDISMPMIYGDGDRAFIRLQEEIMRQNRDDSILAWGLQRIALSDCPRGALATSPADFSSSGRIVPSEHENELLDPVHVAGGSLQLHRCLHEDESGHSFIILHCRLNDDPDRVIAIPVTKSASPGLSDKYERLYDRDLSLLSVPASKTLPKVLRLLTTVHRGGESSNSQLTFYIDNSVERFVKVAEVEPRVWWDEERDMIVPTVQTNGSDVRKVCIRLKPLKTEEFDVLVILDPKNQDSQPRVEWHVLICSQAIELDTVLQNLDSLKPDEFGKHGANNGRRGLHVGIRPELVGNRTMFVVRVESTKWSKEDTVDISYAMGQISIMNDLLHGFQDEYTATNEYMHVQQQIDQEEEKLEPMRVRMTDLDRQILKLQQEKEQLSNSLQHASLRSTMLRNEQDSKSDEMRRSSSITNTTQGLLAEEYKHKLAMKLVHNWHSLFPKPWYHSNAETIHTQDALTLNELSEFEHISHSRGHGFEVLSFISVRKATVVWPKLADEPLDFYESLRDRYSLQYDGVEYKSYEDIANYHRLQYERAERESMAAWTRVQPLGREVSRPQWDASGWLDETVQALAVMSNAAGHDSRILHNLIAGDNDTDVNYAPLTIYAHSKPFEENSNMLYSYAKIACSSNEFFIQTSKKTQSHWLDLFTKRIRSMELTRTFALEFNALLGYGHKPLDCLVYIPFTRSGDSDRENYLLPDRLRMPTDRDEVFDNDASYIFTEAFSHFTLERSRGSLFVDKIIAHGNNILAAEILTDSYERFQEYGTKRARDGLKDFSTHECNDICRELRIQTTQEQLGAGELHFRETWLVRKETTCCSNKLCRKILYLGRSN